MHGGIGGDDAAGGVVAAAAAAVIVNVVVVVIDVLVVEITQGASRSRTTDDAGQILKLWRSCAGPAVDTLG